MTIFLGVLLGGLVGWIGGNFTTRGLAAFARYMDRKEGYNVEDYEAGDTEDAQRIGAGLMVSEAVVLASVGGVVAAYAGVTTAFVVSLVGLMVIPVAVVLGMFAVYEESGQLATFIYRSPVTAVTSSVAAMVFCYKYTRNKIESWIEASRKPAPVTNLPGTDNGEPQPAICVFPPLPAENEVVAPVTPAPDSPNIHPLKPTDQNTGNGEPQPVVCVLPTLPVEKEVVAPVTPATDTDGPNIHPLKPTDQDTGNGEPQPVVHPNKPTDQDTEGEVVSPLTPAPTAEDGPNIHPLKPTDQDTGNGEPQPVVSPRPATNSRREDGEWR
ncbi:MAG: hypothetical protein K2W95_36430 [Candidatus Obscuribacterales bacterium]|nr:hypothetical protein [Candidatus Obscuribacterales bacterium]